MGCVYDSVVDIRDKFRAPVDQGGFGKCKFPLLCDQTTRCIKTYECFETDISTGQLNTTLNSYFIISPSGILR